MENVNSLKFINRVLKTIENAKVRYNFKPSFSNIDTSAYPYLLDKDQSEGKDRVFIKIDLNNFNISGSIWISFKIDKDNLSLLYDNYRLENINDSNIKCFIQAVINYIFNIDDKPFSELEEFKIVFDIIKKAYTLALDGFPVSTEILSIRMSELYEINDIIKYNMVIRGILYKMKQMFFNVNSDDEQYDGIENIKFICEAYNAVSERSEYIFCHIVEVLSVNSFNTDNLMSEKRNIINIIKDIYSLQGLCYKYNVNELEELIIDDTKINYFEYKQPIEAICNTIRSILVKSDKMKEGD